MAKKNVKGEYLYKENKTKKVFYFRDDLQKINIISRIVFKNKKHEIHYPFSKDGRQKYNYIKEISYNGLSSPLPRGLIKDSKLGYGFTKVLSPIIYQIDRVLKPNKLEVSNNGKTRIDKKTLYISYAELNKVYPKIDSLLQRHSKEKEVTAQKFLSLFFPKNFKDLKDTYIKGTLYSIISDQVKDDVKKISKDDFDSILGLTLRELKNQGVESKKVVLETREKIERRFLEDAIIYFQKLSQRKLDNNKLEKDWEKFLIENPWIISNLFATPVFFFQNQAYVGGKEINNSNGKVTDFLYKNEFTDNIAVIELKTHKTNLLSSKPYRGKDVYSLSVELSGAVNQVLNQRQNLIQEFIKLRTKDEWFESYNPKCLVIAGSIADLPKNGAKTFDIFRNSLQGVEIITFDELLKKLEFFNVLIKGGKKKRGREKRF
ncbi:MAG: Shedu immune nuclease family protein [Patescibacteria group bacterium]